MLNDTFTKSERALADHIVRDADSVVMKTITELAGESDSFSTASITRFCKKIGLSGYSELRACKGDGNGQCQTPDCG